MKKSLIILTFVIISVLTLHAQNVFILPDVCGFSFDTLTAAVDIENSDQFVGFQFDLPLPDQASYIENSAVLTNRANGHTLSVGLLAGDTLRIIYYSMNLTPFQGNSGPVVLFQLVLGNIPGIYPLELENGIIADENSQNILTSIENGNLILIGPVAPNSFNLLLPDSGALVETLMPTLDWEDALDPDPIDSLTYTLYWSLDSIWSIVDSVTDLINSEYSFSQSSPLPNNASIWWKVKATDCYELASWSNQIWMFSISSTGIKVETAKVETQNEFRLCQNYPNPFNSSTLIVYNLPCATDVELNIYNIQGRLINRWRSALQSAGIHHRVWSGDDQWGKEVPGGIYFFRLNTGQNIETRKMVFLR